MENNDITEFEKDYKEFLHTASHDLRSHMRHIKEFSRLLIEDVGAVSDSTNDYEHFLAEAVKQLDEKFGSLLEISRVNTTSEKLVEEESKEIVMAAIQMVQENYKFNYSLTGDWPSLPVHPNIFYKMLCSLIENAVKFSDKKEVSIEVNCQISGTELVLSILDNGPGLADEYHEIVFKLFKKLSLDDNSTGAGLTYARKVARKHGGDIFLVNRDPIGGLCVKICLPINRSLV